MRNFHLSSDPNAGGTMAFGSRRLFFLWLVLLLPLSSSAYSDVSVNDARAVARLYSAAFDREPAPAGLNFWVQSLEKGQSLTQIASKFNQSGEFNTKYGELEDEGFVRQLYRNVLRREGADSGVNFWREKLGDGVARAVILQAFSASSENRRKTDDIFDDMRQRSDGLWTFAPVSGDIQSTGTIDGFGSIFVNGVEFETESAEIELDGESSTDDSLRLGMVVTVEGTINEDGVTGVASRVVFDDEIQGPISSIVPGPDGDTLELIILGVTVIAERTSTVFEDVNFDTLAVNDLVEVSGFVDDEGRLRATRLEKESNFVAGASEIELKGLVTNLVGTQFSVGDYLVDFSGADLSELPGGMVVQGIAVEIKGTLEGDTISATRIEAEDDVLDGLDDRDEVSIQGTVTGFVSAAQFVINGVEIDASNAILKPSDLVLANGLVVEAEGTLLEGTLSARKIESRRGRIEIEASVASVDQGNQTITLRLAGGTVTVTVSSSTLMDDDTDQAEPLTLEDISATDFLEVEAVNLNGNLMATRVDRDDQDDDVVQAPVQSFNAGSSITLLGVTYSTLGAKFEDKSDDLISSDAFYEQLQPGDLVKIKDREIADGIADEVEFERENALDGDDEDEDCDNESAGSDDDCETDDEDCDNQGAGSDDDCASEDDDCDSQGAGSDDDCESEDEDEEEEDDDENEDNYEDDDDDYEDEDYEDD